MSNSNCILCNQTLKFTNKSPLGMGKLKDGGEICNDCMKPIRKLGYQSVKKVTLKERRKNIYAARIKRKQNEAHFIQEIIVLDLGSASFCLTTKQI